MLKSDICVVTPDEEGRTSTMYENSGERLSFGGRADEN